MAKYFKYHLFTCGLAFLVILLGAYTRLKHAGLGCPDWPGCYGHLLAPFSPETVISAKEVFPLAKVNVEKAWIEMIHRYIAGCLALIVMFITCKAWHNKLSLSIKLTSSILLVLIVCQAMLGMWTVTFKLLPIVVLGHLLGGFITLSVLWCLTWQYLPNSPKLQKQPRKLLISLAVISLGMVFLQIMLGGWTSANYAALACPDFPFCNGQLLPSLDLETAWKLLPADIDEPFQHQTSISLITIHFFHRVGAMLTAIAILLLCRNCFSYKEYVLNKLAWGILFILVLQVLLGITNVLAGLPLAIAVAHNGVAACLLLSILSLNIILFTNSRCRH